MEIITSRDVYVLLSFIPNTIGKAYVTHIFSSGMSKKEALSLDVKSLISACDSAFRETEKRTLENLLIKDPAFITPMWQMDTKHGKKITFSSSESLFYMFIYLKERLLKKSSIELDEKLFVTGDSVLSSPELDKIFKYSEKCCLNHKEFTYSVLFGSFTADSYCSKFHFTTKDLTNNFEKICDIYLPLFTDDEKEIREYAKKGKHNIKRRKLQQLFCQGLSEEDEYYKKFAKDIFSLKEYYSKLLPYLTAKNYEIYPELVKSAEDKYLFDKINKESLEKTCKKYSDKELDQELVSYLKYSCDSEPSDELINIFKKLAIQENNHKLFKDTKEHLDNLMEDAKIVKYVSDLEFETRYINENLFAKEILVGELDKLGLFKEFNIDEEKFLSNLEDYLSFNKKYNIKRNLSKNGLAEVLTKSKK